MAGERTITYAELDARSSQAAQAMRAAGVGFGDRVAFVEKNGAEFFGHLEAIEDRLTNVGTIVAVGSHGRWPGFAGWLDGHPAEDSGATTGPPPPSCCATSTHLRFSMPLRDTALRTCY